LHRLRAAPPGRERGRGAKGSRLIHDRLKLATGRAAFAADLDLPGALHAALVTCPHPAARLVSVNAAAARALPGVTAVLTALDEDASGLLDPRARFAGAPWAIVAAEDPELAERAAETLLLETVPEGSCLDVLAAATLEHLEVAEGDAQAAATTADRVVEGTWRWPFLELAPVEPPATLAWLDEDDRLVVRATTSAPFALRAHLAKALRLPASGLRVVRPQIGAPFGVAAEPQGAALCAAATLRTGRPVRLIERTSAEPLRPEAAHVVRLRAAFRNRRLAAVEATLVLNLGAEATQAASFADHALFVLRSAQVPFRLEAKAVLTSLRPLLHPRRAGAHALRFALEGALDEARPMDDASRERTRPAGAQELAAIERALLAAGPREVPTAHSPRRRGRGVALAGAWSVPGASATAGLTLNQDGSVVLRLGSAGVPAGLGDPLVTQAAAVLGVAPDRFSIVPTDTDTAPGEDSGPAEPRLLAQVTERAAEALRERMAGTAPSKAAGAASEASVVLEPADLSSAVAAVVAEVELDPEIGLARATRFVLAPLAEKPPPLPAWEDGQLVGALAVVFGGSASALDAPRVARAAAPSRAEGSLPPPLPDLLPAAAAALAHALRDAGDVTVRELPVQPERLATAGRKPKTA
jgi:CO/xanthine dehydrogenase Mo-binding subunit